MLRPSPNHGTQRLPNDDMGKCYVKTGVNVKNGIVQLASVSRRSAFVTSIL